MQTRLSSQSILTGGAVLLLCLVLAVPAMAQRPSLSGLQVQVDGNAALIASQTALIATLQADLAAALATIATVQTSPVFDLEGLVTVDDTNTLEGVAPPHIIFEGANIHVRSGSGTTSDAGNLLGLGNLIIGYNEPSTFGTDIDNRGGSHNLVVGPQHQYTNIGGLVAGLDNNVNFQNASVSGGARNSASGVAASVSGGSFNSASGSNSSVSGGFNNEASSAHASVSGGLGNEASDSHSSVSGGRNNLASGNASSVSGGDGNEASSAHASVSGGFRNVASGGTSSVSGGRDNTASGVTASVSGGITNMATGSRSSVSGGSNRSAIGDRDWVAGTLFESD